MEKADIGLIGLGVMGQNLALNLAGKGWKVAVWNRTVPGKEEHIVDNFIAKRAQGKSIVGTQTLEEFVDALKTPKVVFLMVVRRKFCGRFFSIILSLPGKNSGSAKSSIICQRFTLLRA